MTDKLSIAVVELVGSHGGMNPYDIGLCRGLLSAGVSVSLYTCDETNDPGLADLTFFPIYKSIYGKSHILIRALRFARGSIAVALSTIRRKERIVHFHVFQSGTLEMFFVLLMKLCRRKIVLTVHDVESLARPLQSGRLPLGRVFRTADHLIVHNRTSQRELVTGVGRLNPSRIAVIPIGNYLDDIGITPNPQIAKRSLGIGETKKVILFFGQIKQVKGLDLLIGAMPNVLREVPEAVLVIAGKTWKTDFTAYDAQIDELRLRPACYVNLGYVSDEAVSTYYAAADLVVLPYRRIYQSGVLLLAMSYARAVIVSDLPGMTEIVTDRENGYIFTCNSSESLSQALLRALRNDREREAIGLRSREYARTHHDWKAIGAATVRVYRSVYNASDR